ncbi:hypothetical protein [Desulfosporosinus sp. OT]|uniref:hypothetical protein n=1 Tax=Desulfosporosinus sp. OT TaxID=913865 RepID=UPI000223ACF1|nr:hypothetical protein [Desulfosporosinus sp. OT]EGW36184.1 hypothetical protein DOT_5922 [Desulfosporosinus sp. OT]
MSWDIKKRNWSGTIVTVSTAIFALVSIISVYISVTSWQTQREAARPYFTLKESPSIHQANELSFEFEFKFYNVGTHPATNLSSKTIVFNENLLQEPILVDEYTVVNDIPRDTTTSLLLSIESADFLQADIAPQFVIIYLSYADPITHKLYNQTIYTKWSGVIDQKTQPLIHVELSEKQNILNYLKFHHLLKGKVDR